MDKEAESWAACWEVTKKYKLDEIVPDPGKHPGPITVHMVREACMSFPLQTGLGPDAVQPRAVLRLSDNGIEALAAILTAIEITGEWPHFIQLVMTVIIPKSDGGLRSIGLFPTIYRILMRCRRPTIKEWRKRHARDYRYGGAGWGA